MAIRRALLILAFVSTLMVLSALVVRHWLYGYMQQPLMTTQDRVLTVPRGTGLGRLVLELGQHGILPAENLLPYQLAVRLYDLEHGIAHRLQAGEYAVVPADTLVALLDRIVQGEVVLHAFTLVEGWTFQQLRAALAQSGTLRQEAGEMTDQAIMAHLGDADLHPEGWFAADTYRYPRGESDLNLLHKAHQLQKQILQEAWESRAADLPLASPREALILASIIERETAVPGERREIAGVFINRLRAGMRLQTDPTVIYGMGESYRGRIRRSDLKQPTPYNTYVIDGLPPTPIAMPGAEAIHAAVDPASTDALYFVARGDGSHQFSATLEEHNAAVRQYQKQRRSDYRSFPPPEAQ